jgi:Tfp pilus assembly protein PilF
LSDWNRAFVYQEMISRLKNPPFNGQLNNAARVEQLEARVRELQSRMTAASDSQADADFQAALRHAPDDWLVRENYAVFLQSIGNLPQATAQWRQIHEMLPQDFLAHFELGRMLELQGQWADAEASFRRAVKLRPTLTEG